VAVPSSDYDYKSVYVVDRMGDYLKKRGQFDSFNEVGVQNGEKMETEYHYIQKFADFLGQMQTISMSLLWAPEDTWVLSSPAWEDLITNRDRFTAKSIMPYVGYARSQAVKYTLKAERLETLREFIALVKMFPQKMAVPDKIWDLITAWAEGKASVRLWTSPTGEPMIEVCGKSFSRFVHIEKWIGTLQNLIDHYGDRAKSSVDTAADLKACYHAVRLAKEAKEIISEKRLTYPRPEAELLLAIRRGEYTFDELKYIIDEEIEGIKAIQDASDLPDQPDKEWAREWAVRWQKNHW
jgi:hypothetical protein